jgi:hypothetical protein
MISQTPFSVQIELIDNAVDQIKDHDVFTINQPTGDFFYDQWKIKTELQGTIWENYTIHYLYTTKVKLE